MKYFKNVETLEELRKQYKELLKKYHPDNPNGSTKATQEVNAEYDNLFKVLKDRHEHKTKQTSDTDKKNYDNMKYDFSEDEKLREVLQSIITLQNINIEIVGCWIWVDGNTYEHKDTLKALGFKWAREKRSGIFILNHSEKEATKNYLWTIYGTITEVQKYRRKKSRG